AAALFTAARVEEVQAVATIAAPSSPDHVKHLFTQDVEEIESEGKAEVEIAGRTFTIKKQFLDDLEEQDLQSMLGELRKSLLILHAPHDKIVGIENARELYEAAVHPKSFVSLDGADHLLSEKADAAYVGEVIGTWAARYIEMGDRDVDLDNPKQVAVRIGNEGYTTDIKAGKHVFRADEPEDAGGNDFGPTPYGLLLASLGSCTAMTLKMYADRKEWPFEEIRVHLSHERVYRDDCDGCEDDKARVDLIAREIEIVGELEEKQRDRMLQIANKCPVHKTLEGEIRVESKIVALAAV
ncbi:MAG: OsmC family protein, partial [Saprospiraceae bacterium]|nr:OsmC family protein [Saprospiraceae bacterium]